MPEKYIGDDTVLLCLAGLRYLKKEDGWLGREPQLFFLKWHYKGIDSQVEYKNKKDRDAMYDKVLKALTEK